MVKFKTISLCKDNAMSVVPTEILRFDLAKAAELMSEGGYDVTSQGLMVIAKRNGHEITLYSSGRMLLSSVDSKEEATEVAKAVYEIVDGSSEPSSVRMKS